MEQDQYLGVCGGVGESTCDPAILPCHPPAILAILSHSRAAPRTFPLFHQEAHLLSQRCEEERDDT